MTASPTIQRRSKSRQEVACSCVGQGRVALGESEKGQGQGRTGSRWAGPGKGRGRAGQGCVGYGWEGPPGICFCKLFKQKSYGPNDGWRDNTFYRVALSRFELRNVLRDHVLASLNYFYPNDFIFLTPPPIPPSHLPHLSRTNNSKKHVRGKSRSKHEIIRQPQSRECHR